MTKQPITIDKFNEEYKINDQVTYKDERGNFQVNTLRWKAESLPDSGRAVIWVHGRADAVDLLDVIFKTINI